MDRHPNAASTDPRPGPTGEQLLAFARAFCFFAGAPAPTHEIIEEIPHHGMHTWWDTAVILPDGRVVQCAVEYSEVFTEIDDGRNAYERRYLSTVDGADITRVRLCPDDGPQIPIELTPEETAALATFLVVVRNA